MSNRLAMLRLFVFVLLLTACGSREEEKISKTVEFTPAVENIEASKTEMATASVAEHLTRGWQYFDNDEVEHALAEFVIAVDLDPTSANAYEARGAAYARLGEFDMALADFDQAIELDPMMAVAYSDRGMAYVDLGRIEEAIPDFNHAIELDRELMSAYFNRGLAHYYSGNWDESEADFTHILKLDPDQAPACSARGLVYIEVQEYERAREDFERAIELDPDNAGYYNNCGIALKLLGELEAALDSYDQAIALDGQVSAPHIGKGDVLVLLERNEEALTAYSRAIELDQQNVEVLVGRGTLYMQMARFSEAVDDLKRALTIDEENVLAQQGLCLTQVMLTDMEEALKSCDRSVELDPTNADIYHMRAMLRAELGDRKGAISDVQKALELGLSSESAAEAEQLLQNWQQTEALVVKETDSFIAFSSRRNGNTDIYIIKPDGTELTRLTENNWDDVFPAWSPDGQRIVYGNSRVRTHLWMMDADGSNKEQLTFGAVDGLFPAWSPDGSKIAFDYSEGEQWDIYLLELGSGELTNISENEATHDIFPSWSPDGEQLVFSSNRDGFDQIYIMNADGSQQQRVTSQLASDGAPTWSPNGKQIAFSSFKGETADIYVMNSDGTNIVQLTDHEADDLYPAWSPDGSMIVFVSAREGDFDLFIMNADGSDQRPLTAGPAMDTTPAWRPVPAAFEIVPYGETVTETEQAAAASGEDESLVFVTLPQWEVGETRTLELVSERIDLEYGTVTQEIVSSTLITISVLEKLDTGYVLAWKNGITEIEGLDIGDDPVLQALMNLSQGVVVEYETNEYGDVVAVRNWEEIARLMQQSLEMVAGMLRDAGLSEAEIAEMEALISPMFASQEQVEAFAMESIQLYHLAYGWSPLEQGSPIIYDSQLPNPFGGEPFPALGELALINGDFDEGAVLLHWKQSVDPQFVRQIMMQTLVDMAMWMGNDPPTESDLPDPFVVEDYAEIVFDVESSWNRSLYYVRKIEVGTSLRTDSKHFIDLTYSPR